MIAQDQAYFDAQVLHQAGVARFAVGVADRSVARFNDIGKRVAATIGSSLGEARGPQFFGSVISTVRSSVNEAFNRTEADIIEARRALAMVEVDAQERIARRTYSSFVAANLDRAGLTTELDQVSFGGRTLTEWIAEGKENGYNRIVAAIKQGVDDKETADALVRLIRGTRSSGYSNGVLGIVKRNADMLARMAVLQSANEARLWFNDANSGFFPYWRFTAILDNRTSHTCRDLNGNIYKVNEGPMPPRHPNCRSFPIPSRNKARWSNEGRDAFFARTAPDIGNIDSYLSGGITIERLMRMVEEL